MGRGFDKQINFDGDTLADALVSRLSGIEDYLDRLVDLLEIMLDVEYEWGEYKPRSSGETAK